MNPLVFGVAALIAAAMLEKRKRTMHNCSDDILGYHDDEVTLPKLERDEMRQRRDANRDRLKDGLAEEELPSPIEFKSQGSYAMKTMTRHLNKDYDIDDGVYFEKGDLVGDRGAEMSPLDVRNMVRDALDDGSFKTAPEVRSNCVRVFYDAGYHVDVPVYRRVETEDLFGDKSVHHELASAKWKRSDARDVSAWFEKVNNEKSPDKENGRQLRRITRMVKKFARSRPSWEGTILSGFGITVLVAECYHADGAREDLALYETMKAIKDRLEWNLEVEHPVTPDTTITKNSDDPKARVLREKLADALEMLKPLLDSKCERETALKCWDKVLFTKYFSGRIDDEGKGRSSSASRPFEIGIVGNPGVSEARPAVRKDGGGRYA
ncbi:MAG: hypothetical protein IPJ77_24520 [Planctomycetes bacterium]|nr:hypothetical protein [Planctomycetota bacterium]